MEVHPSPTLLTGPHAFGLSHTRNTLEAEKDQKLEGREHEQESNTEDLLVISPYIDAPHLLDLGTLEPQSRLLAIALINLQSLRNDYATAPYIEIFNWAVVIDILRQLILATRHRWIEQKFYIVVFRSRVPPTTDYSQLGTLDKAAHAEAIKSGGFLKLENPPRGSNHLMANNKKVLVRSTRSTWKKSCDMHLAKCSRC
jgi:hypothetical protein